MNIWHVYICFSHLYKRDQDAIEEWDEEEEEEGNGHQPVVLPHVLDKSLFVLIKEHTFFMSL